MGETTQSSTQVSERSFKRANYFLSVTLQNIRCFGPVSQTLRLSHDEARPARWTILLGENGVGKTTLLQVIAGFEGVAYHPSGAGDDSSDVPRFVLYFQTDFSMELLRDTSADAPVSAKVASSPGIEAVARDDEVACYRFLLKSTHVGTYQHKLLPPICYAYGASRRPGAGSLSNGRFADAAATLFKADAEIRGAEEWLLRADYSASKPSPIQERQLTRLEQIKKLLLSVLPGVSGIRISQPSEALPTPMVEFETHYGWVPLKALGLGYQTMIGWTVDLASRLVERYPESLDPLAEPAVVLVDEIDLHLHPAWQRQLITHLTRVFANTQFIVTAHSPLIVQGAVGANIAVLRREGDHVVIDNDVESIRGWRVDQILTSDLFELPSARPPDLDEKLRRRVDLLSQPALTDADKREVERLDAEIGDLPSGESSDDARRMLKLVEQTRDLLQKYGG